MPMILVYPALTSQGVLLCTVQITVSRVAYSYFENDTIQKPISFWIIYKQLQDALNIEKYCAPFCQNWVSQYQSLNILCGHLSSSI